MTDSELLAMAAEHYEKIRKIAVAGRVIKTTNANVPKYMALAQECEAMRNRILAHLSEKRLTLL